MEERGSCSLLDTAVSFGRSAQCDFLESFNILNLVRTYFPSLRNKGPFDSLRQRSASQVTVMHRTYIVYIFPQELSGLSEGAFCWKSQVGCFFGLKAELNGASAGMRQNGLTPNLSSLTPSVI